MPTSTLVAFVPLAAVRDPALLWVTVVRGARPASIRRDGRDAVRAYLQARTTLLVLDNVEHLLAVGTALVDLLRAAPGLTLLVTSRALLRVSGEHVVTVPPLALPDPGVLPPAGALHRVRRRAALRRALPGGAPRASPSTTTNAARCRGDLPAAGRLAVGDRAGRGPHHGACPRTRCWRACSAACRC